MAIDDTKRLDWLLAHNGADVDYRVADGHIVHYYIRWFRESYWYIVRGKDWRECIDNAIAEKAEKIC